MTSTQRTRRRPDAWPGSPILRGQGAQRAPRCGAGDFESPYPVGTIRAIPSPESIDRGICISSPRLCDETGPRALLACGSGISRVALRRVRFRAFPRGCVDPSRIPFRPRCVDTSVLPMLHAAHGLVVSYFLPHISSTATCDTNVPARISIYIDRERHPCTVRPPGLSCPFHMGVLQRAGLGLANGLPSPHT